MPGAASSHTLSGTLKQRAPEHTGLAEGRAPAIDMRLFPWLRKSDLTNRLPCDTLLRDSLTPTMTTSRILVHAESEFAWTCLRAKPFFAAL